MKTERDFPQIALLGEAAACAEGAAIFVWDEDRNYVAVNDEACRLTGRTREQVLSMRVGDMTADGAEPHFTRAQTEGFASGSLSVEHADGPVRIAWVTCPTRIAGLPYFVSVCWKADR